LIALDTNILVYAHRRGTTHHVKAYGLMETLAESTKPYALFWPSLYEFLRVVTHHRVFDPPTSVDDAFEALGQFLSPPGVHVLSEGVHHQEILKKVLRETPVSGNLMHDAHLVALALEHGVHQILTADADFRRFPQIQSRDPFR
jgi:toxin-antitoxin system PIN domain toxin